MQARELLEVFAVRAAAERRTEPDLARLRATFAEGLSGFEMYLQNKEFHAVLLEIAGNALLKIAAQPIFFVLHTHLARSRLDSSFPHAVCSEHQRIYAHIEGGDADAAEAAMRAHLEYLGGVYRRIGRGDAAG
jgi:DNA-binding GntR family transcriptional regulator